MTGYRDDREAMRQRLAQLESALSESREEASRLRAKLAELESESEEPLDSVPQSAPPSTVRKGRSIWIAGFGTLALFLLGPLLGVWVCVATGSKRPEGTIESTGGELGKWIMHPDRCQSGEHQGFFGVDLISRAEPRLGVRVIVDAAKGKLVNVNIPGGDNQAVQFSRERCTTLNVDVRKTDTQVNEIWLVEGSLELDCTVAEGKERVFGSVRFENCQ